MKINLIQIFVSLVFFALINCCTHTLQAQVELTINNPANIAGIYTNVSGANFGPPIAAFGQITGNVVASDGIEGCSPFVNATAVMGNIALIDRGSCLFHEKTANAQAVGAVAVIICLIDDSAPFQMGGTNDTLTIPAIMITKALCDQIRVELPSVDVSIVSTLDNCTDPCATNYNPFATEDDGSCILPVIDDGCDLTIDSFDVANCIVINTPPNVDDGCPLTTDSFDAVNCIVVNAPPNINDGCDLTTDSFDAANCIVINTPFNIDDGCDLTIDSLDVTNCEILNIATCPSGTELYTNCACLDESPICFNPTVTNVISDTADTAQDVYSIDIDGDGDNDVIHSSSGDFKVAWYANDGQGNFSSENIISIGVSTPGRIYAIDLDSDGDNDVITIFGIDIVWFANDGLGNFSEPNIVVDNIGYDIMYSLYSIDLDGDGDNDVICTRFNNDEVVWYANDGQGNFSDENIISDNAYFVYGVYSIDLDGDGDNDVISGSSGEDKVAWYANDGQGNFSSENIISNNTLNVRGVYSIDLDSDGDNDILAASSNKNVWYSNDGQGNFSSENIISNNTVYASRIFSIDLDSDGDNDVISTFINTDKVAWYVNDGQGNFSEEYIITTNADIPTGIYAIDIDGDGDNDVISSSARDDKIAWYENQCNISPVSGCTNHDACNFDATATTDDGECILPGDACDDSNPLTDNDIVQADCSCQGEIIDSDIVPTVGQWGLLILALLLLNLGVLYIRQTEMRIEEA